MVRWLFLGSRSEKMLFARRATSRNPIQSICFARVQPQVDMVRVLSVFFLFGVNGSSLFKHLLLLLLGRLGFTGDLARMTLTAPGAVLFRFVTWTSSIASSTWGVR